MKEKLQQENEQVTSCNRTHDILVDFKKKAQKAVEEDMGIED
ncbi:MAG: hypothetical protein AB1552_06030 [Nitrospirota bacterium]